MPLTVHLSYTPDDAALIYLQQALDDNITLSYGDTPTSNYEILVAGRPTREQLTTSPKLRAVLIPFAGLPAVTKDIMQQFPQISVHNLHHNAPPTAEMALALLLAAAKRLIPSDREFRQHDWTPRYEPYPALLLQGKTALILGYGAIGQHLGTILKAMGMTVLATRRSQADAAQGIYTADKLHELLPQAHVLIVALPATPATEGLIGADELALLPDAALVVNIGRGAIIDQHALYDALQTGKLFGAASDVWYNYPPDKESQTNTAPADVPFHELDNMVLSPHRAGGGRNAEIEQLRMHAIAEILNRAAQGDELPHKVDLGAGY